jgi:phosphohistidine swiveling domain-containing protein
MPSSEMIAHFVVEGEFLTDHARSWVLSNDPGRAWRMLRDSLCVDDEGQKLLAVSGILTGAKRFIGDSNVGLDLVDDDTAEGQRYARDLAFIYAGRVKINGGWYRPAAKLEGLSPNSGAFAAVRAGLDGQPDGVDGLLAWWKRRAEWYCHSGSGEIPVTVNVALAIQSGPMVFTGAFYVFEPCSEPPVWITPVSTPEEAVQQWLTTGHRLENRCEWDKYEAPRTTDEVVDTVRDALNEATYEEKDRKRRELLEKIRHDVLAQAKDDLFELVTPEHTYSVPRAPFVNWALARTALKHLAPTWNPVSPWGLKIQGDSVYHSDWMVGCGFDVDSVVDYFNTPIMEAAHEAAYVVKAEYGDFKVDVLATAPECEGYVGTTLGTVFLLKDLSNTPENNDALDKARAIITERGGALSHLSVVAREMKIPIFRVPDATKRFLPGTKLRLNASRGTIDILDWKAPAQ